MKTKIFYVFVVAVVLAKKLNVKGMNEFAPRMINQRKNRQSVLFVKNEEGCLHLTNLECNTKRMFAVELRNQVGQATMLLLSIRSIMMQIMSLSGRLIDCSFTARQHTIAILRQNM